jgi:hypothetical protein
MSSDRLLYSDLDKLTLIDVVKRQSASVSLLKNEIEKELFENEKLKNENSELLKQVEGLICSMKTLSICTKPDK